MGQQSRDSLSRNCALFDSLVANFGDRVQFELDERATRTLCSWSFILESGVTLAVVRMDPTQLNGQEDTNWKVERGRRSVHNNDKIIDY